MIFKFIGIAAITFEVDFDHFTAILFKLLLYYSIALNLSFEIMK